MFRSSHYTTRCVLVGVLAGRGPRRNATTAWTKTSTGLPIAVTFYSARPPAVAHFCVSCPGLESTGEFLSPKVVCQDADLVVLRVPLDYRLGTHPRYCDHFIYRVDSQRPRLDLLPKPPFGDSFGDNEIAVLSCNDGTYVVAALEIVLPFKPTFKLHLYRSTDGKQGSWTSQILSVEEKLRNNASDRQIYHMSTKVITLGGDKGLVGWVDLWRGILLCDVLSVDPKLRDIPLPLPAMGNRKSYLNGCPSYSRDITVNKTKDTISYVEMEITLPKDGFIVPSGNYSAEEVLPDYVVPGSWTATTWRMPIRVDSPHKWHHHRTVHLSNISLPVGNQMLYKLLDMLLSTSRNKEHEATGANLSLGGLCMAYPTLSIDDDDVVHFSCHGTCMRGRGSLEAVVSVDLRAKALLGVAVLDTKRHPMLMRSFVASGISIYLKTEGPRASICQEMSEAIKALRMKGAENSMHGVPTLGMQAARD